MQTLALGAELELKALMAELYDRYSSDDAPGTLSLLDRLRRAYLFQVVPREEAVRGRRPPGPRPPGMDGPMLARDEIEQTVDSWVWYLTPGDYQPSRRDAANLLPTLAAQADEETAAEILPDIRRAHQLSLLVLGLADPPVQLRGARCLHCRQQSIVFDKNADQGDVWCSNSGPRGCHDSTRYPDCEDEQGFSCRRSDRSQRHCYRWSHAELPILAAGRTT